MSSSKPTVIICPSTTNFRRNFLFLHVIIACTAVGRWGKSMPRKYPRISRRFVCDRLPGSLHEKARSFRSGLYLLLLEIIDHGGVLVVGSEVICKGYEQHHTVHDCDDADDLFRHRKDDHADQTGEKNGRADLA